MTEKIKFQTITPSYLLLALFCIANFILLTLIAKDMRNPILWIILVATYIIFCIFFTRKIQLTKELLTVSYAFGLLPITYKMDTISKAIITNDSSIATYMYDPLSAETILINFRDGKKLLIATPKKQELLNILWTLIQ